MTPRWVFGEFRHELHGEFMRAHDTREDARDDARRDDTHTTRDPHDARRTRRDKEREKRGRRGVYYISVVGSNWNLHIASSAR